MKIMLLVLLSFSQMTPTTFAMQPDPHAYCKKPINEGDKFGGPCEPYCDDDEKNCTYSYSKFHCVNLKAVETEKNIACEKHD